MTPLRGVVPTLQKTQNTNVRFNLNPMQILNKKKT